jgi:Ca2+-binding RTX toxin-like protein
MNTVDGGFGNDYVTAHSETEFNAYIGIASNVLFGGSGNDVLDRHELVKKTRT